MLHRWWHTVAAPPTGPAQAAETGHGGEMFDVELLDQTLWGCQCRLVSRFSWPDSEIASEQQIQQYLSRSD
jgi:hypothetical protein